MPDVIEMYEPQCLVTCCMQLATVQDLCMCLLPLLLAVSSIVRNMIKLQCHTEQGIKDDLMCLLFSAVDQQLQAAQL